MFQDDVPMRYGEVKKNADKYDQLVLRAGFGNTWLHWTTGQQRQAFYTRDAWAKRMMTGMGYVSPRTTYMHLFINGLYWGVYNPTERVDEDFCELRLGGNKENYDVLRNDEAGRLEATAGTDEAYRQMFELAKKASYTDYMKMQGLNRDGSRNEEYPVLLDVENFIDYMLLNQYGGNGDWDHHNWTAVRRKDKTDKGFQWIPWDSELVLQGLYDDKLSLNNNLCPTNLFQMLMTNSQSFRQAYFDRLHLRCTEEFGRLTPDSVAAVFERLCESISQAMYCESARWGDYRRDVHPYTSRGDLYTKEGNFDKQRKNMLDNYFPRRTDIFVQQVKERDWCNGMEAPQVLVNGELMTCMCDTVDAGTTIRLRGKGVRIYTIDGRDPMGWTSTGSPKRASGVTVFSKDFTLTEDCVLRVRSFDTNTSGQSVYSPLTERRFIVRQPSAVLLPDTTDPDDVNAEERSVHRDIYSVGGARRSRVHSGFNIVGGKKVLVK